MSGMARGAAAAGLVREDHVVAGLYGRHCAADFLYNPSTLVAENRWLDTTGLPYVDISSADTARHNANKHLLVAGCIDLERLDRHGPAGTAHDGRSDGTMPLRISCHLSFLHCASAREASHSMAEKKVSGPPY